MATKKTTNKAGANGKGVAHKVKQADNNALTEKIARQRMALFCESIAKGDTETRALLLAGMSRKAMYAWCEQWPDLEEARMEAVKSSVDVLREAAHKRAVEGITQPVYQRGAYLGDQIVYSDNLLALLLKGADPNTYANRQQISGPDGGPIPLELRIDIDASRRRLIEKLAKPR